MSILVQINETTVGALAESLNALGAKPADLVGILESLHAAGALQAAGLAPARARAQ